MFTPTVPPYPSIEAVNNLTRVVINDAFAGATSTLGEGRIYTDSWSPNITVLNGAIQCLQRDLETMGLPTTRNLSYAIATLPPISGGANPATVPYINFSGYWNGASLNTSFTLPADLLIPLKIRWRITSSGNPYKELHEFPSGLPSCNQTSNGIGGWRWFQDRLNFIGSLNYVDLELDYIGGFTPFLTSLPTGDYATTGIPFLDSTDAIAYKAAYIFCQSKLPKGGADELQAQYEDAVKKMANRWLRAIPAPPQNASVSVPAQGAA